MSDNEQEQKNPYFNLHALRRLFNVGGKGRGVAGQKNRISKGVTITPDTLRLYDAMQVKTGPAGYLSPIVELSLLVVAYLAGGEVAPSLLMDRLLLVFPGDQLPDRLLALSNDLQERKRIEHLRNKVLTP